MSMSAEMPKMVRLGKDQLLRYPMDMIIDPILKGAIDNDDIWDDLIMGARDFTRRVVEPNSGTMEKYNTVYPEIIKEMKTLGFFGVSMPSCYAGADGYDFGITGDAALMFELCAGDISASVLPSVSSGIAAKTVLIAGTEEQKKKIIPRVATGDIILCYALTESTGSSFRYLSTTAERVGDNYRLKGKKIFISEADNADYAVIVCKLKGSEKGYANLVVPNLDKEDPLGLKVNEKSGYRVVNIEDKPGLIASHTCEFELGDDEEGILLPEEAFLSDDYTGKTAFGAAIGTLGFSRPAVAAQALGAVNNALNKTMRYMITTPRGDGTKYLSDIYPLNSVLSEIVYGLSQKVSYLFDVTNMLDDATDWSKLTRESRIDNIHRFHTSHLKAEATLFALNSAARCMSILGGASYSRDSEPQRIWRDVMAPFLYEGGYDLHKAEAAGFIGKYLKDLKDRLAP